MEIPDFRNRLVREQYRYDTTCTDSEKAGDMWIPSYSKGEPIVPDEVYCSAREKWDEKVARDIKNGFKNK